MGLAIGVDIGGTKVLAGVVDDAGKVIAEARRDTPADDVARTRDLIVEVITELAAAHDCEAAGIGAAGWIDAGRSTVLYAPNLAWRREPLRDSIAAQVTLPVFVDNDANAAAWAEYRFGAGQGARSLVLLTVGTGIGGGIILDGHLVRGAHGIAAEFGHTLAVEDGHPCGCGARGCLEQYTSGTALVRYARASQDLLARVAGDPSKLDGPAVTRAAQDGDPAARAAFAEAGRWLGYGMADAVQILDPDVIVVGGGVSEAGELLLDPARRAYAERLAQRGKLPVADIRLARLGNQAGLVGAADLARTR
ncbi:ROK family glucokinase [Longispora albida]|uniref:ROK family glucokinase n=1 Tax=Longispora albida TaxID=203523 RepID=UPI00037DCC10|nr:ROK family glucokinase [Longispora albida]